MLHFSLAWQEVLFVLFKSHWMLSTTHQINPWHCVNRKLAPWSSPTMVIWTFVASCLSSSLLSYWLCVITRVPSSLDSFVIDLILGSYLGEQAHKRPFKNAPTSHLQRVVTLQKEKTGRRRLLLYAPEWQWTISCQGCIAAYPQRLRLKPYCMMHCNST